jgi:hypothetical protein
MIVFVFAVIAALLINLLLLGHIGYGLIVMLLLFFCRSIYDNIKEQIEYDRFLKKHPTLRSRIPPVVERNLMDLLVDCVRGVGRLWR